MLVVLRSINVDGVMKSACLPRIGETRLDREYLIYSLPSPGGEGVNQVLVGDGAGAQVAFVGCVGEDELAPSALAELRAAKIELTQMASASKAATGYASVTINEAGENTIIVASGANQYVRANQLPQTWLKPGATVLLQGELLTNTQALQWELPNNIVPTLGSHGAIVFLWGRVPESFRARH